MAPNRPSGDRLVQLVAVPSTEEADVIVAMLAGHGIRARTSAETALLDPHHRRPDEGARVMVRAADLGRARELLEEDRPELMWERRMVRFLSQEWFDEVNRAAAASARLRETTAEVSMVIQQIVTRAPQGDVAYLVVLDRGRLEVRAGIGEESSVTISQDYATAAAISRGDLPAHQALSAGRLRFSGDVSLLLRHQAALAGVDSVFAVVRAHTTY